MKFNKLFIISLIILIISSEEFHVKRSLKFRTRRSRRGSSDKASKDFDILAYANEHGKKQTLIDVVKFIYDEWKLEDKYPFDKLQKEILEPLMENYNYKGINPYHNILHAADAAHSVYIYVTESKIGSAFKLSRKAKLALLMAAVFHDYGHPGIGNFYFQQNPSDDPMYQDLIVNEEEKNLESYHAQKALEITKAKGMPFGDPSNKLIESAILGTDMGVASAKHKKHIEFIKEVMIPVFEGSNMENANVMNNFKDIPKETLKKFGINSYTDFVIKCLECLVHAADISNPTKEFDIYIDWSQRVTTEFFDEGALETSKGLKLCFTCPKKTGPCDFVNSQVGFINFVIRDFFEPLSQALPGLKFLYDNVESNFEKVSGCNNDNAQNYPKWKEVREELD